GNTLITEGADGRLFEVTPDHELVWEYVSPFFDHEYDNNMVYRSYRYPYDYIPQLEEPEEIEIPRLDRTTFRVPGVIEHTPKNVITFESGDEYQAIDQLCIVPDDED
ncbi:MAG: thioredoxin, partial [Desulfobulbia bacterium]